MKVLCHEGSRTAKLNALHESVVCAHVQHPNVVRLTEGCISRQSPIVQSKCMHVVLIAEFATDPVYGFAC